jgi:hypothetical protein
MAVIEIDHAECRIAQGPVHQVCADVPQVLVPLLEHVRLLVGKPVGCMLPAPAEE